MAEASCFVCSAKECSIECQNGCGIVACHQGHFQHHLSEAINGKRTLICRPFRVCDDPAIGRHFVAVRDISPMEEIFNEKVSVLGPATKSTPVCLECLQPPSPPGEGVNHRCAGCNFPMCASHKFASSSNVYHTEAECKMLEASKLGQTIVSLTEESLPHACIFLSRMWSIKKSDPVLFESLYFQMDGDTSDIDNNKSLKNGLEEILQNKFQLKDFTTKDILRCMGIKRTNANNLDSIYLSNGVALYSIYPLMNHQCNCNTSCVVDPQTFQIKVFAQRKIAKGEQITTRYLAPWEGQPKRILKISQQWHFICQCTRCQDPSDLGTFFSGIKCSNVTCQNETNGYLVPVKSQMLGTPWQCHNCSLKRGHRQISEKLESLEAIISEYISKQDSSSISEWLEPLVERLELDLHPNHFLIFKLKKKLVFAAQVDQELSFAKLKFLLKCIRNVLQVVEVLDPGVTLQRATMLKKLATVRVELARRHLEEQGETFRQEFDRQMGIAVDELKKALTCINSKNQRLVMSVT